MKIVEKISAKNQAIYTCAPATIVFLGDSVTQGCFEVYFKRNGVLETVYESDKAYSANVKRILNYLYPAAQINVINSGISGDSAAGGVSRFERDVAPFHPDLVVVGFALNDSCQGEAGLEVYEKSLREIFAKVKAIGAECIFLTPNLMNDKVSANIHDERIEKIAAQFMAVDLDKYVETAKRTAAACGVPVCDVYAKWKAMQAAGVDTTALLSNDLNHPTRELHWMTAYTLVETMFKG